MAYPYIEGSPPHPGYVTAIFQDPLSPGSFSRIAHFHVGTDPQVVAVGDLNDDGLPDLVTANNTSDSISILFQDPGVPGNFLGATNIATGDYPQDVAISDLNGDGLLDLAVADNDLSLFFQDPGSIGTFLSRVSLGVSSNSVDIGDLDGDLLPDLAVTRTNVKVLLQDPATPGTFLPAVSFATGDQPNAVAIGDLNADGLPDLAVNNSGPADGSVPASVSVLLQDPATPGSFLPATNYINNMDLSSDLVIGDLNDDGRPDLAIAGFEGGDGFVPLLFQDPAAPGAFLPTVNLEMDYLAKAVAIGDLNEDTLNDLAVADSEVYIRFQNLANPGTFFPRLSVLEN